MRVESIRHETLHVVTGHELMVDGREIEVRGVAPHAHHLVLMGHLARRIGDSRDLPAGKERIE